MIEIKVNNSVHRLPENWEEIPPGSLYFVASVLVEEPDFIKARIKILRKLLNISKVLFMNLSQEQVLDLIDYLSWMDLSINTKIIFKTIKLKHKRYRLPDDNFELGTAFQYALADDYYRKFHETKEDKYMYCLISTLLYDNVPLTSKEYIEKRAMIFTKLTAIEKVVIMAYFGAVKNMIYDKFRRYLFTSDEDSSISTSVDFGWWGRYMDIAESGVFGDIQGVYKTRFYDVVVYLIQKKEQYLAEKRAMEEIRNNNS